MKARRRETLARQLTAIGERINCITRMMEEDADCIEMLCRLQAIRVALSDAKKELYEDYLERWADALVQDNDLDQCKELLEELPVLFNSVGKINTAVINHPKGEKT